MSLVIPAGDRIPDEFYHPSYPAGGFVYETGYETYPAPFYPSAPYYPPQQFISYEHDPRFANYYPGCVSVIMNFCLWLQPYYLYVLFLKFV